MEWVTVIWSAVSGACLMLALMHFAIWCRNRRKWANLGFFIAVLGVLGMAACELMMMYAKSPQVYAQAIRIGHLAYFVVVIGILVFVHHHFGTGKIRLLWLALALRMIAVVANFTTGQSLHVAEIRSLSHMEFLGQTVTILGEWQANRWVLVGQLSSLLMLIYILDASWTLWKSGAEGSKRRALAIGGTLAGFVLLASGQAGLVAIGALRVPFLVSFPFLAIVLAMGYELSRDVFKAANLSVELRNSQLRLSQAAAAASMVIWEWDVATGRILVSDKGRGIYGLPETANVDLSLFLSLLHEHDRPAVRKAMDEALAGSAPFAEEYRVMMPDGSIRWIAATGYVERDAHGHPLLMRGVSIDATERKSAEMRMELQRQELAHLSRVSVLGEMAGTLAHELNQPLAAILSNSQVGRRQLDPSQPDLAEIAAILDDISDDAKRAGSIIHGMRAMLKKSPPDDAAVIDVNETIQQVMNLLQSEIITRKKEIHSTLGAELPKARAGQVEVQQILINILINGLDAMQSQPTGVLMRIETFCDQGWLIIAIRDAGPGIPPESLHRLFEPFYSSKPGGLGLGLPISRSIAERLGGELHARNHPEGGAEFRLLLPIAG